MSRVPFRRAVLPTALLTLCLSFAAPAAGNDVPPAPTLVESTRATVANVWHGAQDLAIYALGLIGVDYRYGGNTPEEGLDCSGLVRYVFQQVTGVTLPRTSKEMSRVGKAVAKTELKPGDLVFFNTRRFAFSHVGIYLGDDRFVHSPRTGRDVEIAELDNAYWRKHFNGARRLVGVLPGMVPTAEAATLAAETPAR